MMRAWSPVYGLLAVTVYCLVLAFSAVWLATGGPWLGLELQPHDDQVQIRQCQLPCHTIEAGSVLQAIRAHGSSQWVDIQTSDLIEDPDVLSNASMVADFMGRQDALFQQLVGSSDVDLGWYDPETSYGGMVSVQPMPRPVGSLPFIFWFQLLVGTIGCLVASWVWVLKPDNWGVRLFALTGLMFPLVTMSAAIYSTRELALPAVLFEQLTSLNEFGSIVYGAAFAAIFLAYPVPLVRRPVLLVLPLLAVFWGVLGYSGAIGDANWRIRVPIIAELTLAAVLAFVQWRLSQRRTADLAALRWLILSLLLGGSLYIFSHIVPTLVGWEPLFSQGYEFGFFLIIYLGVALGLWRYRLFDLDVWAYRLLLAVAVLLAVPLLDALLIYLLGWSSQLAFGVALWLTGLLYLPFRHWLVARLTRRGGYNLNQILLALIEVAFEGTVSARRQRWVQLLQTLYSPVRVEVLEAGSVPSHALVGNTQLRTVNSLPTVVALGDEGIWVEIPGIAGLPALRLWHRNQARHLFSLIDVRVLTQMCHLLERAETGRKESERAVLQERQRMTRDLHDDVGARLLMLIHRAPTSEMAELARQAMVDLRAALYSIDAGASLLSHCLADWRSEAQDRCDAALASLEWLTDGVSDDMLVQPREKMVLERALRESLSNCFKHADTDTLHIRLALTLSDEGVFHIECRDNGYGGNIEWHDGLGLAGLRHRLQSMGGSVETSTGPEGSRISITLRLGGNPRISDRVAEMPS